MTISNPRSRMISVRISEEEYSALRLLCSTTGARSVSDLARDAMRVLVDGMQRGANNDGPMEEFKTQMKSLSEKIEQLTTELTTLKVNVNQ